MSRQDLLELYQLTAEFNREYESNHACSMLEEIKESFAEHYGEDITKARNPREAGRKKKYDEKTDNRILELKKQGKTVRNIAQEAGCSVGYAEAVLQRHRS